MSEKNDIIDRLTEQLDAAGRQIDQMGVKVSRIRKNDCSSAFLAECSRYAQQ